jgi:colanic acid/amylovoran biosynthesis protein WcaK/AmsJ
MNKKILFHGNGAFSNRGCEAIARTTIELLEKNGICNDIVNFQSSPYIDGTEYYDSISVKSFRRDQSGSFLTKPWILYNYRRLMRTRFIDWYDKYLNQAGLVMALGGDNYSLDYGCPWHFVDAITSAVNKEVPFVIWGASVGPFSANPSFEEKALDAFRKCRLLLIRESNSYNYLADHGVTENVRLVADPAFLLEPEKPSFLSEVLLEQIESGQAMGLNLSPLLARYRGDLDQWKKDAASILEAVADLYDGPILLVPHVIAPHDNDDVFLRDIQELSKAKKNIHLVPKECNSQQLKWVLSKFRLFVGARTHSTIAALSSCVPTISIGYSSKAKGINVDVFGHTDWMISNEELVPEVLLEKLQKLMGEEQQVRTYLEEMMPRYQDKARLAGKYLVESVFS